MWALIYTRGDGDPGRHRFGMGWNQEGRGSDGFVWDGIGSDQPGTLLGTGWTREVGFAHGALGLRENWC